MTRSSPQLSLLACSFVAGLLWVSTSGAGGGDSVRWKHLSSANGDLPAPPGQSHQQTGVVVADFDRDGGNDFIVSFREAPPALVWYRRLASRWEAAVIERDYLTVEAGGAAHDIDGDGDLDVVFGGDWQSPQVWWWENPAPDFGRGAGWKRHLIKNGGKNQHHDQVFADFLGTGRPQLAFWNQGARTIFLAEIPENPRERNEWPMTAIFSGEPGDGSGNTLKYPEGMSASDIDGDGRIDLLAGNAWFKHLGGRTFRAVPIARVGGLIFAGRLKAGRYPQIVISPGDGVGPLRWYDCAGNPESPAGWTAHDLLGRDIVHGHSLQLGDVDRDGNLDIFAAEMAKWHEKQVEPDHPDATAWLFLGDGKGGFTRTEVVRGHGWHEARLADLDSDGDLDILNKPYNWQAPRIDLWLNETLRNRPR